ncbi:hypothetical protein NXS19_005039 [Fusarium pseudograminearum]|nr:hypothetical protein NXS19_005039 [Fusarium pseudograminearum]
MHPLATSTILPRPTSARDLIRHQPSLKIHFPPTNIHPAPTLTIRHNHVPTTPSAFLEFNQKPTRPSTYNYQRLPHTLYVNVLRREDSTPFGHQAYHIKYKNVQ